MATNIKPFTQQSGPAGTAESDEDEYDSQASQLLAASMCEAATRMNRAQQRMRDQAVDVHRGSGSTKAKTSNPRRNTESKEKLGHAEPDAATASKARAFGGDLLVLPHRSYASRYPEEAHNSFCKYCSCCGHWCLSCKY